MTLEELDKKYTEAGWLIARRSASAAGKALMFGGESLEAATREIAAIFELSDEERDRLAPTSAHSALDGVQKTASGLFGGGSVLTAKNALTVAKTAVENGRTAKVLATFVRAGPKAAGAAAKGAGAASKGSILGWVAQAGYAVGSAGWFGYHARAFSLEAYKLVAAREGVELPVETAEALQARLAEAVKPVAASVAAGASVVGEQAGVAWEGAVDAGGKLASAAGSLFSRVSQRFARKPSDGDQRERPLAIADSNVERKPA